MLRQFQKLFFNKTLTKVRKLTTAVENTLTVSSNQSGLVEQESSSILSECKDSEEISHIAPYLKPTFNFASYVNKSETLQELLKLGVSLYKLEQNEKVPPFIMSLNFETDIKNHVIFLHELGLTNENIGYLITRNPFIFKESLEDLETRINYLKFKKFTNEMILRIVENNPFWLSYSTQQIDEKLGFFQNHFRLSGAEVRLVAVTRPRLITYDQHKIKINTFAIKEEMGFSGEDVKTILLKCPRIFAKSQISVLKTFEYLHKTMKIELSQILSTPEVLTCRPKRLKERHAFLEKLGRAQYNPREPNYVSLLTLASGDDSYFATEIAKSSIQIYNSFLKTL